MFIINTEYSIGNMKENVALSGIWNYVLVGCDNHYTPSG